MTKPELTLVRRIKAPVERVYAAWTDPQLLLRWFGPTDEPVLSAEADVRVGGRFRIVFQAGGETHDVSGEYLEVVEKARLVFTWQWITMPERRSQVTVSLRPVDGGTELTLSHAQFADATARDSHRDGWQGALDKLDELLTKQ